MGKIFIFVVLGSALLVADSRLEPAKNGSLIVCPAFHLRACQLERRLQRRIVPLWNSSLRLNTSRGDVRFQIERMVIARSLEEHHWIHIAVPAGVLNPAVLGIVMTPERTTPDRFADIVSFFMRKLLSADHPWRKKTPPRCRATPDDPTCVPR